MGIWLHTYSQEILVSAKNVFGSGVKPRLCGRLQRKPRRLITAAKLGGQILSAFLTIIVRCLCLLRSRELRQNVMCSEPVMIIINDSGLLVLNAKYACLF